MISTTATVPVSPSWQRAMERALREGLKATLQGDGTFRVRSVSEPGKRHIVTLDEAGRIISCSDCKGWERYGRTNPCKHAGAVALARCALSGQTPVPARQALPFVPSPYRRGQLYREAGA